jgi:hypothetical protein
VSVIDIVQIIEELESIASSATKVPGLRRRVMVDMDRLVAVGGELRSSIPSDIQEAREILRQKESILNQTQLEARRIKEAALQEALSTRTSAEEEKQTKVDETEILKVAEAKADQVGQQGAQEAQQIMQDAQRRAYRIIDEAEAASTARREGADQYARETLFNLEERLAGLLGQVRKGIDALGIEVEARIPS